MFSRSSNQPKDERAVVLASQISEANEHDVPLLLLKIKELIGGDGTLQYELVSAIWHYDLMHVLNSCLIQNPSKWNNGWQLMVDLYEIQTQCCCALVIDYKQTFDKGFLPDVISLALTLALKLSNHICKLNETGRNSHESYKILRCLFENTITLVQTYRLLATVVVSSKTFLQALMIESSTIFILVASFLQEMIKIDRNVLSAVKKDDLDKIIDEFVFKISTAKENEQAKSAMMTLLLCLDIHPPLAGTLLSNRYRGLRTFLGKWKGKGMDDAIQRFVTLLNSKSTFDQQTKKRLVAATVIQAWYRGLKTRRRLRCLEKTISKAQKSFRYRKCEQEQERLFTLQQKIVHQQDVEKRRKNNILSQTVQLKVIDSIPAKTVHRFLDDLQEQSAITIQSAWRGYMTRRNITPLLRDAIMIRAAMIIQRQVRKWLGEIQKKRDLLKAELLPTGLNDLRRAELQQVIARLRGRFPKSHVSQSELSAIHSQATELLDHHFGNLRQSRRKDAHCRAVVARIKATADLINGAPILSSATPFDVEVFCSNNVVTKAAAIDRHKEALSHDQMPWWKKLDEQCSISDHEGNTNVF